MADGQTGAINSWLDSAPYCLPSASACNQSCSLLCPCRRTDRWRAKYELLHVVRTHMGQDDAHYG